MLIYLCLHVNLLRDDAICEGNPGVRVRERHFLVANRSGPLHVDCVHVLRVPVLWLLEGHRLNALDVKGKEMTPYWRNDLAVSPSHPLYSRTGVVFGIVGRCDTCSRGIAENCEDVLKWIFEKLLVLSVFTRFSTSWLPPSVSLSSSLPRAAKNVKTKKCLNFFKPGDRGTMMEGAQSEQSDGEQATPMDFLVLTYPVPET